MVHSAVGDTGAMGWAVRRLGVSHASAPAAEATGSLRDVLAALRNLEHLLRSPRVGPRALAEVIPGLRDLGAMLSASADDIRGHLQPQLYEDDTANALSEFLHGACIRLDRVLAWAAKAGMDAKSRLSFEAQIGRLTAELDTARRLLDMLLHAAERADTELDLGEIVQESLSVSGRREGARDHGVRVVADLPYGVHAIEASVRVLVPLVTLGVAWVYDCQKSARSKADRASTMVSDARDPETHISVLAERSGRDAVAIRISDDAIDGDVHVVHLPIIIPPVLACAQASARVGGGAFQVDGERVTVRWPSPERRET